VVPRIPLRCPSMAVAEFFARYMRLPCALAIEPTIIPSPVEVEIAIPSLQDHEHASTIPLRPSLLADYRRRGTWC